MNIKELKLKIDILVEEINSLSAQNLVYPDQQKIVKENITIRGEKGTHFYRTSLYIQPHKSSNKIDICLHGKLLEKEMYKFVSDLCGKQCDGYKQPNDRAPYWRIGIDDFHVVKEVAYQYAGLKSPKEYFSKSSNDKIVHDIQNIIYPEEVTNTEELYEGIKKQIIINSYERNLEAREECIKYYGPKCSVCNFDFYEKYGEIGLNFIHVHHLIQISSIGKNYKINPIKDLKPVCPNCHAMLHKRNPSYTIEELKIIMSNA